jgi:hypothetical protein
MFDKRVARGSTYAAMVIPAGTNPDAMVMDKKNDSRKAKSFKRPQVSKLSVITFEIGTTTCAEEHLPQS